MISWLSDGGMRRSGRRSRGGTGISVRCLDRMAISVGASNGSRPVTISYSIAPSAYTSVRASTVSPRICSGAMYCGVPIRSPARVIGIAVTSPCSSRSLAMPKSSTRTTSVWRPRWTSITLSGLRSRCTMPREWASASDAHSCSQMASARPGTRAPSRVSTSRSETPSRYSIAMNRHPSASWPKSNSVTVFGCESRAASSASALKRRTMPGSAESSGRRTFSATVRLSEICSAL